MQDRIVNPALERSMLQSAECSREGSRILIAGTRSRGNVGAGR